MMRDKSDATQRRENPRIKKNKDRQKAINKLKRQGKPKKKYKRDKSMPVLAEGQDEK